MFPGNLGPGELLVVGLFAVLLFGKKLPEVGRSLGKGLVEFKKGLRGEEDEPWKAGHTTSHFDSNRSSGPGSIEVAVPKFQPPDAPGAAVEPGTVARPYQE